MKIKKIQLRNWYKRFHNLTIDLWENPKRIIALIWPNWCWKSSVFDWLLFHNNAYRAIWNKWGKDYIYHSMTQAPNFWYNNISIEFDIWNFATVRSQKQSTWKENTIFSFRSPYRYNNSLNVLQSQATSEIRLNNYWATTTSDLDDKMEENYRRLYIKYNKYLHENDCKPSEAKLKIIWDLNSSLWECLDVEITSIWDIEAGKWTLYFKKLDHPSEFNYNVLSSWEKEVVDILLDLYLRQDEYSESIFLIDEPELHINTWIQRKLLIEINKLISENSQIWISTHSIWFLRALQEDFKTECQIIQFEKWANYASEEKILTPIKMSISKWKDIFETALDDLVWLISPRQIIYCEWKDNPSSVWSEKWLDAIVYNNIFWEEYTETLFISAWWNTELDQRSEIWLKILSKVFSNVEILVLKDRDMASWRITTESDRELYLSTNPSNHRILKRWEIENYLYDKEVLKKYCSLNSLAFDENSYDNFVTDIINQNLKDKTNHIKNFCWITTSLNPDKFKIKLSEVISSDMIIYQELKECVFW